MSADKRQIKLDAKRRAAGLKCSAQLDKAVDALRAYLSACNECNDASASLSKQGKGRDGREILIHDMAEYSVYLDGMYSSEVVE
jgi:hypothetical protein